MSTVKQMDRWREANPWILQNIQSSQTLCGRFASLDDAVQEANRRGGVVSIRGFVVSFSEMPSL